MRYVMPTNEEVTLLPALSYEDARSNYEDMLYSAGSLLTHPEEHVSVDSDMTMQDWRDWYLSELEQARKIFVLACHRAGIF